MTLIEFSEKGCVKRAWRERPSILLRTRKGPESEWDEVLLILDGGWPYLRRDLRGRLRLTDLSSKYTLGRRKTYAGKRGMKDATLFAKSFDMIRKQKLTSHDKKTEINFLVAISLLVHHWCLKFYSGG